MKRGGPTTRKPLALARWAVAQAERGEAVAVEIEAPARPILGQLIDEGALKRALLLLERDGHRARIAARPRRAGGATTITELFEEDHRRLDELAADMRRTARVDAMHAIVIANLFTWGLRRHMNIEETIILPMHEARTRYAAMANFAHDQHRAILSYIERLEREADALRLQADRGLATGRLLDAEAGLAAILAQHNQTEEQELFPLLDHTMRPATRASLLRQIVTF
jgi:hemerythrin-like domain-containing protein